MIFLTRILASGAIVGYALIWTGLALVMLFTWEAPRGWVGWLVIVGNPLTVGILSALISRRL